MSAAKRLHRRQEEASTASDKATITTTTGTAASPAHTLASSKRLKTINGSHVPRSNAIAASTGLGFLVDEDARAGRKLEAKLTNGVPRSKATRVDETLAVIAAEDVEGEERSGSEEEDEEDKELDEDEDDDSRAARNMDVDEEMVNGDGPEEYEDDIVHEKGMDAREEEEPGELSFGEMLQTRHPDPIDVSASLPTSTSDRQALVRVAGGLPTGLSSVTVLTQALKTNDRDLLESCLQTNDIDSIRATIERLPSQHVAALLQRLAERIHKRPGRTGNLMVWVQWSLIAHGGYLASQPDLMKKLRSLSQVVRERAKGLQPLLHLKGKLDMLSAQLELRRKIQQQSRAANAVDEDDDENVIYIEGQRDDWSDSESGANGKASSRSSNSLRRRAQTKKILDLSAREDSEEDQAMTNGISHDVEDDASDDEDGEDSEGGLLDIEADETSNDEDQDDEGDSEDEEEGGDSDVGSEDSSVESDEESIASGVREPKPQMLNRKR